jgi:molybdopterin-guanine dinucleotide biosynthesis protein B
MAIRAASFIGWSNTGKTGFIEACIQELDRRGIAAGALKFVHHGGSFSLPGKDTSRFFEAGADTALVSDGEIVSMKRPPASWNQAALSRLFPEACVVLLEGKIIEGAYRLLVGGSAASEAELKRPLAQFDALITDNEALAAIAKAQGLTHFGTADIMPCIDSILGGTTMDDRTLTILNDGKEVPLNPFVKETFENVILGLFKTLKKVNPEGDIVITLGAEKH